jgi:uncharacterized protein YerC
MKNLDHPYQAHQQALEKARLQEKFRLKNFSERNIRKYWASRILSYITNVFSVGTGFTFLLLFCVQYIPSFLSPTLTYFIAGAFTLIILVSIEYFKRESIYDYYVEGYLKNHQVFYISVFFNIGLITASVFLSVRGADLFVHVSDQNASEITQQAQQSQDSLYRHYQKLLVPYQQKVNHYSSLSQRRAEAHVWGRLTEEENQDLTFANAQIQKYETLQNQALSEAKQKFSDANLKAQDHTNTDAQYMMWFAGLNELACILLIFFVHYYEYRKWHEYQTQQGLNGVKPEKGRFKQGLNGFGGHAPLKDEIEIIDNHYKDTVVGFKPQYKEPDFDANQLEHLSPEKLESKRVERLKNLNDLKAFLKKYAHVVKCVQEGMSNSEVTDACDVSLSTLHNVKRCMRSVQAYTNEEFANI